MINSVIKQNSPSNNIISFIQRYEHISIQNVCYICERMHTYKHTHTHTHTHTFTHANTDIHMYVFKKFKVINMFQPKERKHYLIYVVLSHLTKIKL